MPDLLTVAEAADLCRVTPQTVRRWGNVGVEIGGRVVRLMTARVGGRVLVPATALARFQRECNQETTHVTGQGLPAGAD